MKKYKVEFTQTEVFCVDVYANNETEAEKLATGFFESGCYNETASDCELSMVYDVTDTDDFFDAQNVDINNVPF